MILWPRRRSLFQTSVFLPVNREGLENIYGWRLLAGVDVTGRLLWWSDLHSGAQGRRLHFCRLETWKVHRCLCQENSGQVLHWPHLSECWPGCHSSTLFLGVNEAAHFIAWHVIIWDFLKPFSQPSWTGSRIWATFVWMGHLAPGSPLGVWPEDQTAWTPRLSLLLFTPTKFFLFWRIDIHIIFSLLICFCFKILKIWLFFG